MCRCTLVLHTGVSYMGKKTYDIHMSDQIHAINIHWRLDTGLSISVNCPMFSSNKRWYAFYFFRLRIFCCFFFFEIVEYALTKNSMPEAYPPDSLHYLPIRFLLIPFETYYYALFAFAERCRAKKVRLTADIWVKLFGRPRGAAHRTAFSDGNNEFHFVTDRRYIFFRPIFLSLSEI